MTERSDKMIDIVLINPPIADDFGNHPLPYGLWQLGSFAQHHGFNVEIIDLNFYWRNSKLSLEKLANLLKKTDSNLFGFTCMGNNFPTSLELAESLKKAKPECKILFGGPHVSLISEETLEAFSFIDHIIVGEGEWTLVDFLKSEKNKKEFSSIPGLLSRSGSFMPRALMPDLNELPYLNLNLIDWKRYLPDEDKEIVNFPILAGSGCPFQCTFCSTSVMWERRFRTKSPKRLAREMEWIAKETGHKKFDLVHDIFTANKKYLNAFCNVIAPSGLKWSCSSRIDGLNEEQIQKMAISGCESIFFGVESGSSSIQKIIGKRLKVEKLIPTMAACVESGIDCVCSTIFGFPEESWEDIESTVRICTEVRSLGIGRANLHLLMPLPGTRLYREAKLSTDIEDRDLKRSSLPIFTKKSRQWIAKTPRLFSAFYWVEHPTINKEEMYSLGKWDDYLATHPGTLKYLLEAYKGSFGDLIASLTSLKESVDDDSHCLLKKYVFNTEDHALKKIYEEESLQIEILNEYGICRSKFSSSLPYWVSHNTNEMPHLYVIGNSGVSIDIYQLEENELSNWKRLAYESSVLKNFNCYPVQPISPIKEVCYETGTTEAYYS